MIGWLNDINRLVSKDKKEPRVIPAENTHTLALYAKVISQLAYLLLILETPIMSGDIFFSDEIACFDRIFEHIKNRYKSLVFAC